MRQETNNEIDLLLRRLSRREGLSARDGEAQNADTHLDADELSSYAQNALPAAARARYTEHVAECSTCRKLVTELSLSLGATAAQPVATVSELSGLKKFLAAFFSPMVLRYAAPALGLIVVMVVGFVALRRQQQSDGFVARVDVEKQGRTSVPAAPETPAATPSDPPLDGFIDAPQEKAGNTQRPATKVDQAGSASGTSAADADSPTAPVASPREEKPAETSAYATATPPPLARAKDTTPEEETQKKAEAAAKRQAQTGVGTVDAEVRKENVNETARDRQTAQPAAGVSADQNKPKAAPSQVFGITSARPDSRSRVQSEKDDSAIRSVAGRRFRKERGIWVDTAYDSATEPVNVARGSEYFRGLVADEPGIKTIAEQLDGEVIVVWKGRAYRIR